MPLLFDEEYYLAKNRDVAGAGLNAWEHFLGGGAREKRSPHPLFDLYHYATQFDDISAILPNPIEHYLTVGYRIADPHPLFDRNFYRASGKPLADDVNPLLHFIETGAAENRDTHPLFRTGYYRKRAGLDSSTNPLIHFMTSPGTEGHDPHPLFSIGYYFRNSPDVKARGTNPVVQYLRSNPAEFRRPHPLFDPYFYNETYAVAPDIHLLVHYLTKGARAGFSPHRLFDTSYYEDQNNDVDWSRTNPVEHFQEVGAFNGKNPHPLFDLAYYLKEHATEIAQGENALAHYIEFGGLKGYDPHPLFHSKFYAERHKYDASAKRISPLEHYLQYGSAEGRNPNTYFDDRFYIDSHGTKLAEGKNPLVHYVLDGAIQNLDTHPRFDTARYLSIFKDDDIAKANPLKHFFDWCAQQKISPTGQEASSLLQKPMQVDRSAQKFQADYLANTVDDANAKASTLETTKTIVALYEPQVRGAKDLNAPDIWLSVVRQEDRIRGLPSDLGFYDLRNPSIIQEQWLLAERYGVSAFCINLPSDCGDRRVLPLDQFDEIGQNAPVHLISIQIKANGSSELPAIAARIAKYTEHPRYLTMNESKVVFVQVENSNSEPKQLCDELQHQLEAKSSTRFRVVPMPGESIRLSDSPGKYRAQLEKSLRSQSSEKGLNNLVFIDSWNFWTRGTQLEPDFAFGHSFLENTKYALEAVQISENQKVFERTEERLGRRYFGLPESANLRLYVCELNGEKFKESLDQAIASFTTHATKESVADCRLVVHLKNADSNASRRRAAILELSRLNDRALVLDYPLSENELKNLGSNCDHVISHQQ